MSNPAVSPPAAVAALLNGQTLASVTLASGTNLFSGPERPKSQGIPSQALFCCEYDGPAPSPFLGQSTDLRTFKVQLLIRGKPGDYDGTKALADACVPPLQRAIPSGYIDCLCLSSGPGYLGRNQNDEPRFSLNLQLRFKG